MRKRSRRRSGHFPRVNRRLIYMGDVRQAPFGVADEGEVKRPYFALWVHAESGFVVSTALTFDKPVEALRAALMDPRPVPPFAEPPPAGATTTLEKWQLPGRAIVFSDDVAAQLRPALAARGIDLIVSERVEPFEAIFQSLFERLGAATTPTLDVPVDVLTRLCHAAEGLWLEKPWRYAYDHPPVCIESLDGTDPPLFAAILGAAGEVFGVAFYTLLADYLTMSELDEVPPAASASDEDIARRAAEVEASQRHRVYVVSFDKKSEVPADYRAQLADGGWSRRYAVVPSFLAYGGGQPTTFVSASEAARLWPAIEALVGFCREGRDHIRIIDTGLQLTGEMRVAVDNGVRRFRLTMPPIIRAETSSGEARRRRRR